MVIHDVKANVAKAASLLFVKVPSQEIARRNWWHWLRDWLWGYDYFISYHWDSGGEYAWKLAQQLRDRNYNVFLDRADYASGDDWKAIGEVALRNTQRLILVATREAVTSSRPVEHEVRLFTSRKRQIIAIQFEENFADLDREQNFILSRLSDSTLFILEKKESLQSGPQNDTVKELIRSVRVLKRRNLRALLALLASALIMLFSAIGVSAALRSKVDRARADMSEVVATKEREYRDAIATVSSVEGRLSLESYGDSVSFFVCFDGTFPSSHGRFEGMAERGPPAPVVEYNPILVDDALQKLGKIGKVVSVEIAMPRYSVSARGLRSLLASHRSLEILSISYSDTSIISGDRIPVADEVITLLKEQKELQYLALDGTIISNLGIDCICDVQSLRGLSLVNTELLDADCDRICQLINLETLNISNTKVTPSGLWRLKNLPRLKTVICLKTSITQADEKQFEILRNGKCNVKTVPFEALRYKLKQIPMVSTPATLSTHPPAPDWGIPNDPAIVAESARNHE